MPQVGLNPTALGRNRAGPSLYPGIRRRPLLSSVCRSTYCRQHVTQLSAENIIPLASCYTISLRYVRRDLMCRLGKLYPYVPNHLSKCVTKVLPKEARAQCV